MVEDSEDDALLIERELRNAGFNVSALRVDTRAALDQALTESWDIVLCDWMVPGMEVLESVGLVLEKLHPTPVLIVSGEVGEETAVLAMRAGARDFISKRNLSRLGPAIERELSDAERQRETLRSRIALRESQDATKRAMDLQVAVLDALPATVAVLAEDGTVVAVNQGWRTFGDEHGLASPDDTYAVGQNYLDACLPADPTYAKAVSDGIKSVLDRGQDQFVVDYPFEASSRKVWLHMICAPINLPEGDFAAVMHLDISERAAIEDALRYREQTLLIALDSAGMGTWQLSIDDQEASCSGAFAKLFVDPATNKPVPLEDLLDASTIAEIATAQRKTIEENAPFHLEYSFRAPQDGKIHWVECDGRLVESTHGGSRIVGIVRDVTARKQLSKDLEIQVKEHARALDAINQDLELVRGVLSQDFADKIRAINQHSKAIVDGSPVPLPEEVMLQLQHIQDAGQRTNQLLTDMGRLLRGPKREIFRRQIDLGEVVRTIEEELREHRDECDVEMVVQDGVSVDADASAVTEILITLLHDAWIRPAAQVPKRIEVGTQDRDGHCTYFVRQYGRAHDAAPEHPTADGPQSESNHGPGANVKLAVASRIASRHGGRVWVETTSDQDTTVFFVVASGEPPASHAS